MDLISIVSDLTQIIQSYGLLGSVLILILILIISVIRKNWIGSLISKLSEKFVVGFMKNKTKHINYVKTITESDILNHDIFNYIDLWINSKVPTLQYSTEYRTVVFRKYLTIFLRVCKLKVNEFVVSKEYQTMDDAKLWKYLLELINKIIYEYEKESLECGIPKLIVDKMKAKNNDTISLIIDLIEGICDSQFYYSENNLLKIYSILNILLSVFENVIYNSESVCNSINGAMKGFVFMDGDRKVIEP